MAKYRMQEMPDTGKNGGQKLYPRMEIGRQVTTEELMEAISRETSFSPGDVRGLVTTLARRLAMEMRDGNSVKIDGIGIFSASLGVRKEIQDEEDGAEKKVTAKRIGVRDINFRADRKLIRETGEGIRLERSPRKGGRPSSEHTPGQRRELALAFLRENPLMTISDYSRLTGLSRSTAGKELRQWSAEPESAIAPSGWGTHRVYVKR